jgi:hypothetical protein
MKACLKRPPRLYVNGENARQYSYLLTGVSLLATLVGYSGIAVLIDESEHYSLLRGSQRERADSFFKAMIVSALGLNNGRIDARREIPGERARRVSALLYLGAAPLLSVCTDRERRPHACRYVAGAVAPGAARRPLH